MSDLTRNGTVAMKSFLIYHIFESSPNICRIFGLSPNIHRMFRPSSTKQLLKPSFFGEECVLMKNELYQKADKTLCRANYYQSQWHKQGFICMYEACTVGRRHCYLTAFIESSQCTECCVPSNQSPYICVQC